MYPQEGPPKVPLNVVVLVLAQVLMQVSAQGLLLGVNCNMVGNYYSHVAANCQSTARAEISRLSVKLQAESHE